MKVVKQAGGGQAASHDPNRRKHSHKSTKKEMKGVDDTPNDSISGQVASNAVQGKNRPTATKTPQALSEASSRIPLQTSKPPSIDRSRKTGPDSSSKGQPPGLRGGNRQGDSPQVRPEAKAAGKKKKRTMSTPLPSRQSSKEKEISSLGPSAQTTRRSMSTPSPKPPLSAVKLRAILASQDYIPVEPKLAKRFYEALVMLSILGKSRGLRIPEKPFDHESELQTEQGTLRRLFVRSLAYLCDTEKGGVTTTAIALQKLHKGHVVYWIASNSGLKIGGKDLTKIFLEHVLGSLQNMEHVEKPLLEERILEKAVRFSNTRIEFYVDRLKAEIDHVLEQLTRPDVGDYNLVAWLRAVQALLKSPTQLCRYCYDERQSAQCTRLMERAEPGQFCAQRFWQIRHLIGRLSHTMKAVKSIVSSSVKLEYLLTHFSITRAPSGFRSLPPLKDRNPTLEALAGRMTSSQVEIEQIREALVGFDRMVQLSGELERQCKAQTWRPRVHAELILNDLFLTKKFDFVDGDRYIACSKAACFCCYHYFLAQGHFVVPACHNNVWVNWKAPDIPNNPREEDAIKKRRDILITMSQHIRAAVLDQIISRRAPLMCKPDSATEISSVRLYSKHNQQLEPVQELEDLKFLDRDNDLGHSPGLESSDTDEPENLKRAPFDEDEDSDEFEPELLSEWDLTLETDSEDCGEKGENGEKGEKGEARDEEIDVEEIMTNGDCDVSEQSDDSGSSQDELGGGVSLLDM